MSEVAYPVDAATSTEGQELWEPSIPVGLFVWAAGGFILVTMFLGIIGTALIVSAGGMR
jgi:hypothetical protein